MTAKHLGPPMTPVEAAVDYEAAMQAARKVVADGRYDSDITSLACAFLSQSQELAFYKDRERSICEAAGGVCDGGQYRADIISRLQRLARDSADLTALRQRVERVVGEMRKHAETFENGVIKNWADQLEGKG